MREKLEIRTHTLGVALSAGWPMALAYAVMTAMVLMVFRGAMGWQVVLAMGILVALTFLWAMRLYLGTYLFLPATEYKGARIIARLGRSNEIEISGVLADEIIVKQSWMEKRLNVCHIRQRGTTVYLRGVREPETVKNWIEANFPKERKTVPVKGKRKK